MRCTWLFVSFGLLLCLSGLSIAQIRGEDAFYRGGTISSIDVGQRSVLQLDDVKNLSFAYGGLRPLRIPYSRITDLSVTREADGLRVAFQNDGGVEVLDLRLPNGVSRVVPLLEARADRRVSSPALAVDISLDTPLPQASAPPSNSRRRIFVEDSVSWQGADPAVQLAAFIYYPIGYGLTGAFASSGMSGSRPQTVEIIKNVRQFCPGLQVTNKREMADFVLKLDHEGGKGYARRDNKIAVFGKDGDLVYASSTRAIGNAVHGFCARLP